MEKEVRRAKKIAIQLKGMTYKYTITELCNMYKVGRKFVSDALKEKGYNMRLARWLNKHRSLNSNIDLIIKAAKYYRDNDVTFKEAKDVYGIDRYLIVSYLEIIGELPSKSQRKSRQVAWNKGLSKDDPRVAKYAKTKSKDRVIDGYKKVWDDELNKSVLEHHKVWYENTGKWPDTKNNEQIHHIDGDKLNNDFSNLYLTNMKGHSEIHKEYERVTEYLIQNNLIKFNKKTGKIIWKTVKKLKV